VIYPELRLLERSLPLQKAWIRRGAESEGKSMKEYNGFSGQKRTEVQNWLKAEVKAGRVQWPTVCEACGQTEGVIDAHHEDYNNPLGFVGLCYVCHTMLHSRSKNPLAWGRYKAVIRTGVRYSAAMKRDFGIIAPLLNGQKAEHTRHEAPARDLFEALGL